MIGSNESTIPSTNGWILDGTREVVGTTTTILRQEQSIMTTISTTWYRLSSGIASLPVLVWIHDSLFSFCRVRGNSMEPSLKDGDIVWTRKADFFQRPVESEERNQLLQFESMYCYSPTTGVASNANNNTGSWVFRRPPIVLTGQVIVYRNPFEYPSSFHIKRVVGLGGQVVRLES